MSVNSELEIEGISRAEFLEFQNSFEGEIQESDQQTDESIYHELGTITIVVALTAPTLMLLVKILSRSRAERKIRVKYYKKDNKGTVERFEIDLHENQSQAEKEESLNVLADAIRQTSGLLNDK